jgi:hypothetical protein
MTTFTTEDRIIAEKDGSVTINVEPIPFAGIVTLTETAYINKDDGLVCAKCYKPFTKGLTDAEIQELIDYVAEKPTDEDLYDFAKAILKKAQEK